MANISQLFGINREHVFEVRREYKWDQEAPVMDNLLSFGQGNAKELPKVSGVLALSHSVSCNGLRLTYRAQPLLGGVKVVDRRYPTQLFDTLIFQDTESGTVLQIARDDVVLPHTIPEQDQLVAGVGFAAIGLEKWLLKKARDDIAQNEELRSMLEG